MGIESTFPVDEYLQTGGFFELRFQRKSISYNSQTYDPDVIGACNEIVSLGSEQEILPVLTTQIDVAPWCVYWAHENDIWSDAQRDYIKDVLRSANSELDVSFYYDIIEYEQKKDFVDYAVKHVEIYKSSWEPAPKPDPMDSSWDIIVIKGAPWPVGINAYSNFTRLSNTRNSRSLMWYETSGEIDLAFPEFTGISAKMDEFKESVVIFKLPEPDEIADKGFELSVSVNGISYSVIADTDGANKTKKDILYELRDVMREKAFHFMNPPLGGIDRPSDSHIGVVDFDPEQRYDPFYESIGGAGVYFRLAGRVSNIHFHAEAKPPLEKVFSEQGKVWVYPRSAFDDYQRSGRIAVNAVDYQFFDEDQYFELVTRRHTDATQYLFHVPQDNCSLYKAVDEATNVSLIPPVVNFYIMQGAYNPDFMPVMANSSYIDLTLFDLKVETEWSRFNLGFAPIPNRAVIMSDHDNTGSLFLWQPPARGYKLSVKFFDADEAFKTIAGKIVQYTLSGNNFEMSIPQSADDFFNDLLILLNDKLLSLAWQIEPGVFWLEAGLMLIPLNFSLTLPQVYKASDPVGGRLALLRWEVADSDEYQEFELSGDSDGYKWRLLD